MAPTNPLALLGLDATPEELTALRAQVLRGTPFVRPASAAEVAAPAAIGPSSALAQQAALAEALRNRKPDTGAYELFGGDNEGDVRARAENVNEALRRQRASGTLGLLTGDRVLSGFGQSQLQGADKQEAMLADAGQFRAGQTLKSALAAEEAKRQAKVDAERERHNRAMEGRPPSNVYLPGPGGQYMVAPTRGSGPVVPVADPTGAPVFSPKADDLKAAEEKAATDAANKKSEAESKLRTELQGLQPIKEYQLAAIGLDKVRNAARSIAASIKESKEPTPADDIALLFGYMKTIDPTSVVRETEFATAQNAAGVPDRIRNMWNYVRNGNRLNPEQRKEFIESAESQFLAYEETANRLVGGYRKLAEEQGLDPSRIILEGLMADSKKPAAQTTSAPNTASPKQPRRVPMPPGELDDAPKTPKAGTVTLHWVTGGSTTTPAERAVKLVKEQPEKFSLEPFPPEKVRRKKYSKSQNKTYTLDGNGNVISVEEGNTGGK